MASARTPAELVVAARAGDPRAVARLISLVEDHSPQLREVMALLAPHTSGAQVIGLTGAPGVGKSTSTAALVSAYRARDLRVGVLAIDPSSPFTGGALLGDRVRMQDHALDRGVFIRSMASRGHLGGLSWATPQALRVLDAAGCDVILIETVGVGQAEVDIATLADTTLVLLAPGMGDGVQAAKAGILEIADVLVVNKADRDGADVTARELRQMLTMSVRDDGDWRPPVLKTVAARQEGVAEVVDALSAHATWLAESGEGPRRRVARAADEIEQIALADLRAELGDLRSGHVLNELAAGVVAGEWDPYAAADELLAPVRDSAPRRAAVQPVGDLVPHPEGGRFRETWRSAVAVPTERGDRVSATAITFALAPGESSAWHRVRGSAELWVHQTGGVLALQLGGTGAAPELSRTVLLADGDQHLVAPDEWQAAAPVGAAVQVVCVVSPGFDFADFELEPDGA